MHVYTCCFLFKHSASEKVQFLPREHMDFARLQKQRWLCKPHPARWYPEPAHPTMSPGPSWSCQVSDFLKPPSFLNLFQRLYLQFLTARYFSHLHPRSSCSAVICRDQIRNGPNCLSSGLCTFIAKQKRAGGCSGKLGRWGRNTASA